MTTELTLRDYIELLRRRAWVVVAAFIGALVLALLWSALQTPLYQSSARILINQNTSNDIFDPVTGAAVNDRAATNEVQLLKSELVRVEAEARLGFEANISARAESRADVLVVTAINEDASVAATIAQTYAESYLDVRRNEFISERLETAEKLLGRIQELDAEIAAIGPAGNSLRQQTLRDNLANSYDQLTITADLANNNSFRIIDNAELPEAPFSPRTNRNLALGGVLGLMIGAGAALLLESLDRSIKSREIIEGLTPGIPSLASIPTVKTDHAVISLAHPEGLESEVFRTLRAGIEFASVDRPLQVIQITSPGPSAGKTTVAANLAAVMAQAGQKVAVVDADLRRPRLHQAFGLNQVPGISSVIIGREAGSDAAHSMSLNNGRLWVFPSGPVPPGPSELLGSDRARKTFDSLRRQLDVIIVDTPPVLPVADALVVSRLVDATIVVANTRSTKREDLARALEQLNQAGANVIGTVLNQVKGRSAQGQGYGYGYGYGYAYGSSDRSVLDQLLGRNKNLAPELDGTEKIASSELPRFRAARHEALVAGPESVSLSRATASVDQATAGQDLLPSSTMWLDGVSDNADASEVNERRAAADRKSGNPEPKSPSNGSNVEFTQEDRSSRFVQEVSSAPLSDEEAAAWGDEVELR